jgi:predicted HicB family RNase H-like nuclease
VSTISDAETRVFIEFCQPCNRAFRSAGKLTAVAFHKTQDKKAMLTTSSPQARSRGTRPSVNFSTVFAVRIPTALHARLQAQKTGDKAFSFWLGKFISLNIHGLASDLIGLHPSLLSN